MTLSGRGYPPMVVPDAGPDCDPGQAMRQIIKRIPADRRLLTQPAPAEFHPGGRAGALSAVAA